MSQDTNRNRQLTLADLEKIFSHLDEKTNVLAVKLAQVESINKPSGVTSAPVLPDSEPALSDSGQLDTARASMANLCKQL